MAPMINLDNWLDLHFKKKNSIILAMPNKIVFISTCLFIIKSNLLSLLLAIAGIHPIVAVEIGIAIANTRIARMQRKPTTLINN
jgi:hypothetical protein